MITGKDLIGMGYKPNKLFKNVIEYANSNNLSGDTLKNYMDSMLPIHIEPHRESVFFYKNIKAENEEEANNVKMVINAMNSEVVDEIMPYGCIMAGEWNMNYNWRKSKNK